MKRNLILIVICAIIAAVFFFDQYSTEKKEEREEKEKDLFSISRDEVEEITIQKKEETFKAVKEGENWNLALPFKTAGDKSNWDSVTSTFADGKRQRVVVENAEKLDPFGLDEPSVQVTLAGVRGVTASTILFGDKTPTSGKYYAMIQGTSDVLTVMSSMFTTVDKSLFDMRDKNIVTIETEKVQQMEIAGAGLKATLQRKGEDNWIITEPIPAKADQSKIRDLINKVRNSRIKQFIDENPESLEAYGLVEPATKLTFWGGDIGNEAGWAAQSLLIGSTSANDQWYARRESLKNVFAISLSDFKDIPNQLSDLRFKKLTSVSSWEVKQAKVISAGETILSVSKSGGDWLMVEPKEAQADYSSVSEMLRGIIDLEIADFVAGATQDYDLDSPSVQFMFETDKSSETIELAGPIMKDDKVYYFGVRKEPLEIFALKAEDVDNIVEKAEKMILEEDEEEEEPTPLILQEEAHTATDPEEGAAAPEEKKDQ
ncbi:MAG: DUF4340 domain-containing protein [Candidatus Omnitrophota bacterium]|jgi:hypothetical protein|nr:MAG: DUF4340 domain-containing protein [Candidatus Omnitrophota bacterium]